MSARRVSNLWLTLLLSTLVAISVVGVVAPEGPTPGAAWLGTGITAGMTALGYAVQFIIDTRARLARLEERTHTAYPNGDSP